MSSNETETLERLIGRLQGAAARLREGELSAEEAAELVEQCAQSAAHASAELERLARSSSQETMENGPAHPRDQLV